MLTTALRPDHDALLTRARSLLDAGRLQGARTLLAGLRKSAGPSAELDEIAADLAMADGAFASAIALFDRLAETAGQPQRYLLRRAQAKAQLDDFAGAARDAADMVLAAPNDPAAKATLGLAMMELGHFTDSVACLREALAAEPGNVAFRIGLAEALERAGARDAAVSVLWDGRQAQPRSLALVTASMMLALRQHDFAAAVAIGTAARARGWADACTLGLLGHAQSSLGRHDAAAELYQDALTLAPEDGYVRHLAAAATQIAISTAPADYVRTVFDGYAHRFDAHLISLGYRVPGLIRAALLRHTGSRPIETMLDLGCGTGLIGVVLSDLAIACLAGVDISPRMIAQAEARGIYTGLIVAEAGTYLAAVPRQWDAVVAADMLCYVGALEVLFASVADRLLTGGVFLFSIELLAGGSDWRLGAMGRYAHAEAYVRACAGNAGLRVAEAAHESLRREADAPVAGMIFVCTR